MKRAATLAVLLSLSAPAAVHGQELGRLFFTPDQRSALDARRKAKVPDKPAADPSADLPLTRVDGAVRRAGGKSTVWVNGEAVPEVPQGGPRVAPRDTRVSVPVGETAQRYDLKVGETLDRGSGEVRDVIGEGEIRIRQGKAPAAKSGR